MAIMAMHYNNNSKIYYARAESHFTLQDATAWLADLKACAAAQDGQVVALLDLSRTTRIVPTTYIMIADAVRARHISALVCVSSSAMVNEALQAITAMTDRQRLHVFDALENAHLFAEVTAHNAQAAYA
jgi:hypothetical protein